MRHRIIVFLALALACSPASDASPEEQPAFAEPGSGVMGRLLGGFYPTWEVGTRWVSAVYVVHQDGLDMLSASPIYLARTEGYFRSFEVESTGPLGTVTLTSAPGDEPEEIDRIELDRSGAITKIVPHFFDESIGAISSGHPYRLSRFANARTSSGFTEWPLFPLEPGVRESPDGSWTQTVRADGDARIVTLVFEEEELGFLDRRAPRCASTIVQRWEPGRPFWSYRVSNGCNREWGHGALVEHDGETLVQHAERFEVAYPRAPPADPHPR